MNGANIVTGLEEVGCEAVSQRMTAGWFGKPSCFDGFLDCFLDAGFMDVMAAELSAFGGGWQGNIGGFECFARAGIDAERFGWEEILPLERAAGFGIFSGEGVGEPNPTGSDIEIELMKMLDGAELFIEVIEEP